MNELPNQNHNATEAELADREAAATLATPPLADGPIQQRYSTEACERFAEGLDGTTLERTVVILEHLFALGSLSEVRLAEAIGVDPVELWGSVTNPVKLHAKKLGLPLPYEVVTVAGAAQWEDNLGVAGILSSVMRNEIDRRHMAESFTPPETSKPTKRRARDRYAPLQEYLADLEPGTVLKLEKIESLIGFELPPKAWADETWWTRNADVPYRHHTRAWRDLELEAKPDFAAAQIAFLRQPADAIETNGGDRGIRRITRALFGRKPTEGAADVAESETPLVGEVVDASETLPTTPSPEVVARPLEIAAPDDTAEVSTPSEPTPADGPDVATFQQFTTDLCAEFASGLSDRALRTADTLFAELARRGEVDSPRLAKLLELEPASLAGAVAGPLRRRAKALGCEMPYGTIRGKAGASTMWYPAPGALPNISTEIARERKERGV